MNERKKSNYGYVVLIGLLLLNFLQGSWANTTSIYYVPLSEGLGVSITLISLYSTIRALATSAFIPFVAKAIAKYDTRVTVTSGVLLITAGMLLNASAKNVYMLWISGIIVASASGMFAFMLNPIVLGNWFCKNQATFLGFCMFAQGLGATIYASVGSRLIQNFGWRMSYLFLAVAVAVIGLPISLLVLRKDPAQMGLLPVGYEEKEEKNGEKNVSAPVRGMDGKKAKRTIVFRVLLVALALWCFTNCFTFFINPYAYSIGYTAVTAGVIASAVLFGQSIGSIGNGFTCDRTLKGTLILDTCLAIGGYVLMMTAGTSTAMLSVAAFVVGYAYSGYSVVSPMILRNIFGTKDFADIYSIVSTVGVFIAAFSYTVWSELSGRIGYQVSMISCIMLHAIILICFFFALTKEKDIKAAWEEK